MEERNGEGGIRVEALRGSVVEAGRHQTKNGLAQQGGL